MAKKSQYGSSTILRFVAIIVPDKMSYSDAGYLWCIYAILGSKEHLPRRPTDQRGHFGWYRSLHWMTRMCLDFRSKSKCKVFYIWEAGG